MNESFFVKRMRRRDYAIVMVVLWIVFAILWSSFRESKSLMGLAFFTLFIYVVLWIIFSVKRLHDAEMSGWMALIGFIPIVNWVFTIYLLIKKGTDGSNKYGADPKQNTTIA